jgi:hypothetical protein
MSNHNSYSDQKSSETDPAGTLEKPCSGTFRTQSTTLRESRLRRDWTSLLVNSCRASFSNQHTKTFSGEGRV